MIGDLFDSPWKILIVAVVLIVLFGSKKLPHAARSLGQSRPGRPAAAAGRITECRNPRHGGYNVTQ
jgi:TatA/E family protein of Tat protein translocase